MTLSSFALLLSFADLGIGNGVVGAVARHLGQGDLAGIRRCVATAYAVLFVVALVIGTAFLIAGSVRYFVREAGYRQMTNRSPKITANWLLASPHSRGGRFHSSAA